MNKVQFRQFFRKFADPNDKNGLFAEYVIYIWQIFFYISLYYSSKAFDVFDQNKDGTMNFHEFVVACGMILNNDIDGQIDLVFQA